MSTNTLTALDRCDRCPAAALVAVDLQGMDLLFCAHHFRIAADPLLEAGATVTIDNRESVH